MEKESLKELFVTDPQSTQSAEVFGNNVDLLSTTQRINNNSPILNLSQFQNYNFSPLTFLIKEGSRPHSPELNLFSPAIDRLKDENSNCEEKPFVS